MQNIYRDMDMLAEVRHIFGIERRLFKHVGYFTEAVRELNMDLVAASNFLIANLQADATGRAIAKKLVQRMQATARSGTRVENILGEILTGVNERGSDER